MKPDFDPVFRHQSSDGITAIVVLIIQAMDLDIPVLLRYGKEHDGIIVQDKLQTTSCFRKQFGIEDIHVAVSFWFWAAVCPFLTPASFALLIA